MQVKANDSTGKEKFDSWKNALEGRSDEGNSFYKYFGVWVMFNIIYNESRQRRGYDGTNERKRVESFSDKNAFGDIYEELLKNEEFKKAVNFIVERRPEPPDWVTDDCKRKAINVWSLDQRFKGYSNQGVCTTVANLRGLLGCLYVTRCNLFHGSKRYGFESDVSLTNACHLILSEMLKRYEWVQ